jgi:hypothetical protein
MMARMLELIRSSQIPSNMMQFAARGALAVPPDETIEILVHLALHNRVFGEQARLTLAGWDEKTSKAAAANPNTGAEVLKYFVSPQNLRIIILPELAENPSVEEGALDDLAVSGSRSVVECLLVSRRVTSSRRLLEALQSNPVLRRNELDEIARKLAGDEGTIVIAESVEDRPTEDGQVAGSPVQEAQGPDTADEAVDTTVTKYLEENAAELEVEKDKPFQPIGLGHEEALLLEGSRASSSDVGGETIAPPESESPATATAMVEVAPSVAAPSQAPTAVTPVATAPRPKKPVADRRDSPLQKISKLDIRGRITLAMRGNKEDRSILIRDSTKLVAVAVLESPKITDGEVEAFALQKNVLESVLRAIPMKRRFAKNYNIMRNLVANPRTPLDLSLGLMKNLLIRDLKNLSGNKDVADTIRKVALRMYKQKMEKKD